MHGHASKAIGRKHGFHSIRAAGSGRMKRLPRRQRIGEHFRVKQPNRLCWLHEFRH
ncbi:hypothetical protein RB5123 [Rhodopirellula baltica SH 1]|uniref:Uncharacterized protein n=1 Tax=Rhodopirellula baltica (strain DSM 10527 / NCIMB 13988 / SH1) TaxID=243090 RepID=Q7UGM8_RHOBA|nr:hypothetical protein RB5123 [Rhodopirellula baltica SH 1]